MKPITDVNELFRYQRAIRNFTDEDVPDELVNQVLTAAIHAPSGSNTQPWHFIVIRDQAVKNAISEVYEEARATTYGLIRLERVFYHGRYGRRCAVGVSHAGAST